MNNKSKECKSSLRLFKYCLKDQCLDDGPSKELDYKFEEKEGEI
jgi:hypothetical protein